MGRRYGKLKVTAAAKDYGFERRSFGHFGGADLRRKPLETADFRRNRFVPFSLFFSSAPGKWGRPRRGQAVSLSF